MRFLLAGLSIVSLGASAGASASAVSPCAISAYVVDQDPRGLNVRASPSAKARVLKVVDNGKAGEAVIRGFQNGWFRISRIVAAEVDETLFAGDGWIHGSLLHLDVAAGDPNLYAAPSFRARRLRKLTGDQPGVTLVGCKGEWAQVRVNGLLGWLSPSGQCSNPLTTCA